VSGKDSAIDHSLEAVATRFGHFTHRPLHHESKEARGNRCFVVYITHPFVNSAIVGQQAATGRTARTIAVSNEKMKTLCHAVL